MKEVAFTLGYMMGIITTVFGGIALGYSPSAIFVSTILCFLFGAVASAGYCPPSHTRPERGQYPNFYN